MTTCRSLPFRCLLLLLMVGGPAFSTEFGRPPNVPEVFVPTPAGWFHPTCIRQAAPGERVLEDGTVLEPNGSKRPITPCFHPRYTSDGTPVYPFSPDPGPVPASIDWAWLASGVGINSIGVQSMTAEWTVPNAPLSYDGQILYLFPGLQDGSRILQPVLGYNTQGLGGAKWEISSWNCCVWGTIWRSSGFDVSPGDPITGVMTGSNCNSSTGVCSDWSIATGAVHNGDFDLTILLTGVSTAMTDIRAGALEVYYIDYCNQLPASAGTAFTNVSVNRVDGTAYLGGYFSSIATTTPDCMRTVTTSTTSATINYVPSCNPIACGILGITTCTDLSNVCGGELACGSCPTGQICLSNGSCCTPNQPSCGNWECGLVSNGCGGSWSCGTCEAGDICRRGFCGPL